MCVAITYMLLIAEGSVFIVQSSCYYVALHLVKKHTQKMYCVVVLTGKFGYTGSDDEA